MWGCAKSRQSDNSSKTVECEISCSSGSSSRECLDLLSALSRNIVYSRSPPKKLLTDYSEQSHYHRRSGVRARAQRRMRSDAGPIWIVVG